MKRQTINPTTRIPSTFGMFLLSTLLTACDVGSGGGGGGALGLSVADITILEGDIGTQDVTFLVTLSTPAASAVSIDYVTTDVTAISAADEDYTAASGTLTIPVGGRSGIITVSITGDIDIEDLEETFTLTLTDPSGVTIAATGTIYDDDSLSIGTAAGRQSACDNPWLPLREGAVWIYDGSVVDTLMTVTSVEGDLQNATAQMQWTVPGAGVLSYEWVCTPQGMASVDFVAGGLPVTGALVNVTSETVTTSGQYLLPADQMTMGATWVFEVTWVVEGTVDVPGLGSGSGTLTGTLTQNVEVVGTDPVTTMDGVTRDGLQITRVSNIEQELVAVVNGIEVPVPMAPLTLDQTQTMARDVGIIDMETMSSVSATTETQTLRISVFP